MPSVEEAKRIFAQKRARAHVAFLIEYARRRGGEQAARACAAWLAPLLPDDSSPSSVEPPGAKSGADTVVG